ncbi:hypothetical protein COO60DRAFT_1554028 [Scenedesmus sp. NREL 46B-D3]|nr:hypothetical protein COO60DRAFT_1554028 [Scenedesmus sp. NREL 46B-D3]
MVFLCIFLRLRCIFLSTFFLRTKAYHPSHTHKKPAGPASSYTFLRTYKELHDKVIRRRLSVQCHPMQQLDADAQTVTLSVAWIIYL